LALRDRFEAKALAIPGCLRNGAASARISTISNLRFEGVEGDLLVQCLDLAGVSISTGAACSSGSIEPSSVLLALGLSRAQAKEGIRLSIGWENTEAEVDRVVSLLARQVMRARGISKAEV
jgi:cysteine desulfurase